MNVTKIKFDFWMLVFGMVLAASVVSFLQALVWQYDVPTLLLLSFVYFFISIIALCISIAEHATHKEGT